MTCSCFLVIRERWRLANEGVELLETKLKVVNKGISNALAVTLSCELDSILKQAEHWEEEIDMRGLAGWMAGKKRKVLCSLLLWLIPSLA